ncbi:hypothetical protein [Arthrobacter sp. ISL-28]|uniref:hypothetical protein n=1 Tax=Arthrobacter sp. ISL-28 TaxID=2819108 RepID=UPI001BEB2EA0|nr:hypothetical protein [Arthrobacter sp. ISL-28]MBT2520801.1 hypothetical protein [Arthrobacter sp. ISL-28]
MGGNTRPHPHDLTPAPPTPTHPGTFPQPLVRTQSRNRTELLTRSGGLSIRTANNPYIPSPLDTIGTNGAKHVILGDEEMAERYPQRTLRLDVIAVYDPQDGALRTDQAVAAATQAQRRNRPHQHTHRQHQRNQRQRRHHLRREVPDLRARHHLLRRLVPAAYGRTTPAETI